MKIKIAVIFICLTMMSCASPSKKDCQTLDWSSIGNKIGANGETPKLTKEKYNKVCNEQHGVAIDLKKFNTGYKLGLATYCTQSLGYRAGSDGEQYDYPPVCPAAFEPKFKSKMSDGDFNIRSTLFLLKTASY